MPPVEASVPARALTPDYAGILRFFGRLGCPRKRASRWEAPLQCGSMPFAIAFPSCSRFGLGFPPFRQTKELSASALAESSLHAAWRATASTFSQRPGCCAAGLIRNSFPQSTSAGAQGKISHAPVDSGFPGIQAQRMLLRSVLHLRWIRRAHLSKCRTPSLESFPTRCADALGFDAAFCAFRKCADHAPQKLFGCAQSIGKGKRRADSSLPC